MPEAGFKQIMYLQTLSGCLQVIFIRYNNEQPTFRVSQYLIKPIKQICNTTK